MKNHSLTPADRLERILEAVLFAAPAPLCLQELLLAGQSEFPELEYSAVESALQALAHYYQDRAVELVHTASGHAFRVREGYAAAVRLTQQEKAPRLTRALLETLAIIAYRQPVTRAEIEEIRGVAVSTQIMRTLLDREWIHRVGHKEVPGHPGLYATTRRFLDELGLQSLDALPPLDELREKAIALGDQQRD
jgi:segregation and condensation protein B